MPTQQEEGWRKIGETIDFEHWSIDGVTYIEVQKGIISLAVAQREKEIFRKIKDYDFKENHLCGFNDGEQDCECFIAGLNVALSLITKSNDKPNN